MSPTLTPEVISTLVHAVAFRRDGATLDDFVQAFPSARRPQEVQPWLDELVAAQILDPIPDTAPQRYLALEAAATYLQKDLQAAARTDAAAASPDAAAENAPAVADDPEFVSLLERAIPSIVGSVMPRNAALAFLQLTASQRFADAAQRSSFVPWALERLSHLTLGECLRLGLQPEQFEAWRRAYFVSAITAPQSAARAARRTTTRDADADVTGTATPAPPKKRRMSRATTPPTSVDVLEGILNAAVGAAAAGGAAATSGAARGAAPKAALSGIAKLLATGVATLIPGRLSPTLKMVITAAVGAVLMALYTVVQGSPWFLITLAVVVVGGALAMAQLGLRRGSSTGCAPGAAEGAGLDAEMSAVGTPDGSSPVRGVDARPARTRTLLVLGVGVAAVAILGAAWYWTRPLRPSKDLVIEYLKQQFAPLPVEVAGVDVHYGAATKLGCPLTIQARVATTEPLYRPSDTVEYLRTHAAAEMAAIDAAKALLSGPNGARLRAAIGAASEADTAAKTAAKAGAAAAPETAPAVAPPRVEDIVVLTTQTPPGTSVVVSGTLLAWRNNGHWGFTGNLVGDRSSFRGKPKPSNEATFAVDVPADVNRLNALIAAHAAYAAKVQNAAAALASEIERERRQHLEAVAQRLRPGTLLSGVVVDAGRSESHRVAFEILTVSATTQTLTASLRNDGGWSEARAFQGDWAAPADDDLCTLTLRTRDADRADGAGPLLETRGATTLVLQVHPDGAVTDAHGQWQLRWIEPANAAEVKAEFTRAVAQATDATKAGLVYRGVAVSKLRQTTERVQLRFLEQDPAGVVLRAVLEALPESRGASTAGTAGAPLVRPFRGTILGNTYRAGGRPIRLRSDDADRVARAGQNSPFGVNTTNNSLTIALAVDGTRLVGEDAFFTYQLEPAAATALADDRAGTRDQGPGTKDVARGALTRDQGPETRDSARSALTRDQGPGTRDLSEPARSNDASASPAAVSALDARSQTLAPAAAAADPAASAAASALDPRSQTLDPAPAAPALPGAYALVDGRWVPLTKTKSHLVQTVVQKLNASLTKLAQVEDAAVGKSAEASKTLVGMLTFDGKEAPPVVPAKDLVVMYVGALPTLPAKDLARYPVLQTYPPIELAPATLQPSGVRQAPMFLLAPGYFAFGPARVAATIEHPEENVTLLRCATRLARGPYALLCGSETYEVRAD